MADENANEAVENMEACDCGCCDEEEVENLVLSDENGSTVEVEYIGSVDYQGDEYVVFLPVDDEEDATAEVMIFKVETGTETDEEGEECEFEQYVPVDSEETLDEVFAIFKKENSDAFDFVEE